ncbi:MAG TPA: hypothetical protein VF814_10110 [Casimicrobiaceae bacterium]
MTDFESAMHDVYDFFHDVNNALVRRGLRRLDDMLRPAMMSGLLSDMLTASLAQHSRSLTENRYFNGHPDLIVRGRYAGDCVASGTDGIVLKSKQQKRLAAPSTLMAPAINGCASSCTESTMKLGLQSHADHLPSRRHT